MRLFLFLTFLSTVFSQAHSQTNKKPIDHSVYDGWQSITSEAISNDGNWVLYSIMPQEGDAKLIVTNRISGRTDTVPRVAKAEFTFDSRNVIFLIKPFFREVRSAKIKKVKAADMPADTLGILNLENHSVKKIAGIKSYQLPAKGAGFLACLRSGATDHEKKTSPGKNDSFTIKDEETGEEKLDKKGSNLILLNLVNNIQKEFNSVTEYIFSKDGSKLAFASVKAKRDSAGKNGAFIYDTKKGLLKRISSGMAGYKNLTFDESGQQFAFVASNDIIRSAFRYYSLFYYSPDKDTAAVIADNKTPGMREKWSISNEGDLSFSKNSKGLFFGTAPLGLLKDTTLVDFELAKVDIWNYKDDYIQPMQLKRLEKDQNKSYRAIIYPGASPRIIQLSDDTISRVSISEKGNPDYALGISDYGHRIETQWTGSPIRDLYLISLKNGNRKKIASDVRGDAQLSPSGKFVVWYGRKEQNWYAYNVEKSTLTTLNKGLKEKFWDETNDVPDDPQPYGIAAFTEGDKGVLIYDRYDIWRFDLAGGKQMNVTNGYGRRNDLRLRYFSFEKRKDLKEEEERIEVVKDGSLIFIDAFNNGNKYGGWYQTQLGKAADPVLVTMGPVSYSRPVIAANAQHFIYKKENYSLSPDLYVSSDFRKEKKLSAINPQQKNFNWGTAVLIKWTTPAGHKSEGVLYKPEDFDPAKKYPVIVYFYEKLSERMHTYNAPAPTPSKLNISYFVSNSYLVFTPDISYETGHPGRSAEEYINSGVEELKKNAWVDGSRIGIQGQSWGGYQVAHLITRTDMYAAAWAGAPVVNMTSAYGGIRWETGMNRQFQYEKTQSRIGATLWEKPELYIENSPLFHLPNVKTPVAIMANDADGAVPWYQGIEMFTALRRLNKPVWMLNYNNEAHNLVQRQNRKDIQRRQQQFFDHFLKGAPAPEWMEKGVPATQKGINWGFSTSTEHE